MLSPVDDCTRGGVAAFVYVPVVVPRMCFCKMAHPIGASDRLVSNPLTFEALDRLRIGVCEGTYLQ